MGDVRLVRGDATKRWSVEDNSLDSIVTDPPYGIEFMGEEWDKFHEDKGMWRNRPQIGGFGESARLPRFCVQNRDDKLRYQAWTSEWASEAFRALKPGGFLLAFGATRMAHRMTCGFEDAGFEIVDTIEWLYTTGFPKAQDIGKMFDRRAGVERPIIGTSCAPNGKTGGYSGERYKEKRVTKFGVVQDQPDATAPVSPLAVQWDGWKTPNLKPAHEPIVVARKPYTGTCLDNITVNGVGAFNIDGCRIGKGDGGKRDGEASAERRYSDRGSTNFAAKPGPRGGDARGRFPANVVTLEPDAWYSPYFNVTPKELSKKASSNERKGETWTNKHPTVKPVELIRWLQRLVTPKGGRTASPFLGSGTDAVAAIIEGFDFFGIEMNDEYWSIIEARVKEAKKSISA